MNNSGASVLSIKCNLDTGEWSVDDSQLRNASTHVEIGFTDNTEGPNVEFQNLRFGFILSSNDVEISRKEFPRDNHYYISSDQEYLHSEGLNVETDKVYDLLIWVENAGLFHKVNYQFTGPIPEQPYPSWTWDETNKTWIPPVAEPQLDLENPVAHRWSESSQSWVEVSEAHLEDIIAEAAVAVFHPPSEEEERVVADKILGEE